jgi:hypothetical protein
VHSLNGKSLKLNLIKICVKNTFYLFEHGYEEKDTGITTVILSPPVALLTLRSSLNP